MTTGETPTNIHTLSTFKSHTHTHTQPTHTHTLTHTHTHTHTYGNTHHALEAAVCEDETRVDEAVEPLRRLLQLLVLIIRQFVCESVCVSGCVCVEEWLGASVCVCVCVCGHVCV